MSTPKGRLAHHVVKRAHELLAGLMLLVAFAAQAQTQTKTIRLVYTDVQGTVIAKTDVKGNIVARYDYRPYGAPVSGPLPGGPGYTGHVNDPTTGLIYMQQRYDDPVVGQLLSVDPVRPAPGNIYSFNRYGYANGNPIANIDPDGRNCTRIKDSVTCDPHVDGLPPITFPAPKGWPREIKPGDENYHAYNKRLAGSQGSGNNAKEISDAIANFATPGGSTASAQGSYNNASPQSGLLGALGRAKSSPVMTYIRTDSNGKTVVVNVTLLGHPLFPGYVERGVTTATVNGHNYAIINSAGEGTGELQSKYSPVANWIDNVWIQNSQQIFDSVSP